MATFVADGLGVVSFASLLVAAAFAFGVGPLDTQWLVTALAGFVSVLAMVMSVAIHVVEQQRRSGVLL